jgi:hypothetical protein
MIYDAPGKCPICDGELHITKLQCKDCGIELSGDFKMCKFCQLDEEMKFFIASFIKCRGNIKEVEKELGISYPTVRNRLDKAIEALGFNPDEETNYDEVAQERQTILQRLSDGEITAEQATNLLKNLK